MNSKKVIYKNMFYTFLHFKRRFINYIFLVKYIANNIKDYTYNTRLIYFLHIYNSL
jgi:hypothetical protein